jgi:hypothetical protein
LKVELLVDEMVDVSVGQKAASKVGKMDVYLVV